jgi:hypothetical protein
MTVPQAEDFLRVLRPIWHRRDGVVAERKPETEFGHGGAETRRIGPGLNPRHPRDPRRGLRGGNLCRGVQ